ncbi:MAG TPA: hypothetical protein VJG30_03395 [Candidatus Nanoarchaeia archaeon]|nr:hypothetical protein [Candidatus Nanoarchaeia archaeon]
MKLAIIFILLLLITNTVQASVGIGISPAKITDTLHSKEEKEHTYTVYNTGNLNITAKLEADGEIKDYIEFYPEETNLLPEPEPHRLPPVNGKQITMKIKTPKTKENITLKGNVIAYVNPGFGGLITTGAVASKVELTIIPKDEELKLNKKHLVGIPLIGLVVLLVIINVRHLRKKIIRK